MFINNYQILYFDKKEKEKKKGHILYYFPSLHGYELVYT